MKYSYTDTVCLFYICIYIDIDIDIDIDKDIYYIILNNII